MINDDRLIMQTRENWDFGPDMTGDITHRDYPDHLAKKYGEDKAHLVTADGSFDCQDNPDEQENSVSWLHLKETLVALRILRTGKKILYVTHLPVITPLFLLVRKPCREPA